MAILDLDFHCLPPTSGSPVKVADGVGEWKERFGPLANEQTMWVCRVAH